MTTTTDRLAALTDALTAEGWTYVREVYTEPQWRSRIHELQCPEGRLRLDASLFPDGHVIARLSAEAIRTGPAPRPAWMTDLHEVPLAAALAAVSAANGPESEPDEDAHLAQAFGQNIRPRLLEALLITEGWDLTTDPEEDRDGRIIEVEWESADGHRRVLWEAEDRFDSGGWTVTRWHTDVHGASRSAVTQVSQYTPVAVIAALAMSA
ncbi:hypothetical protein [Catenulispora rubra]|uniref:hypothetical protein n=1 Tax=Catenulispora rubra TaxID=280293 RepID=UPI0018927496|nr:hypothetical protein [Catenulispora rubra]